MYKYQEDFISFSLEVGALRFGEFTLKSGRLSPYFFNTGIFSSGASLNRLGRCYAESLQRAAVNYDLVYGPAYKGIPLAAALAMAAANLSGSDKQYAFDRKELKDHGEGGRIVGAPIANRRVVVVDDVISSGSSILEAAQTIRQEGGEVVAAAIALDRMERGESEHSAVAEVEQAISAPVVPVITLDNLIEYLVQNQGDQETLEAIRAYRQKHGTNAQ
ncbi:orotate phosphoribosyltransferase [Halorhodospira halochloris]|uniref:Orotate phosphoribosyltransferase n=1 Tax=Halorhodospira halochloris TaxID=1052 RepID=A0A0X8X7A2_HALHR|nr:orotate phosphoribosyltransferase [Halorhodospira halochloris]MBK1650673.1 orotate phosphoribosyltransferase [Halorhodospira halochloris]MCG5529782.1 orotate phosphoribosyltransferase [Halorhodospira halochloris]MCG5548951.1 orotate phosphoribosyltransferase [Halorhodospira halochloris]BAU56839.1 orotate phosphoribosyltransferase [Halorhodospira halochloris]